MCDFEKEAIEQRFRQEQEYDKRFSECDFYDDEEKMRDFRELTKEEFLQSYSYLTEAEYENTLKRMNEDQK